LGFVAVKMDRLEKQPTDPPAAGRLASLRLSGDFCGLLLELMLDAL
jgi:hypothetical protein